MAGSPRFRPAKSMAFRTRGMCEWFPIVSCEYLFGCILCGPYQTLLVGFHVHLPVCVLSFAQQRRLRFPWPCLHRPHIFFSILGLFMSRGSGQTSF